MLPPEMHERAARNADWHLQITIVHVQVLGATAIVSGPVVRLFRGPQELLGTTLSVHTPVVEADTSPPPGMGRFPVETLGLGRVLEAFLEDAPEGPSVVLDLAMVLDAPTETPQRIVVTVPRKSGSRVPWIALLVLGALALYVTVRLLS